MPLESQFLGLNQQPTKDLPPPTFQIDSYDDKLWRKVPLSWFTTDLARYKYPPETYKLSGAAVEKWTESMFDRHYFPQSEWPEHKTGTLEMNEFSKSVLISAQQTLVNLVSLYVYFFNTGGFRRTDKFITQLRNGIKKDLITDSETDRRRKRVSNQDPNFVYGGKEVCFYNFLLGMFISTTLYV